MKVLLFGARHSVGQGVLQECLLDPDVTLVKTIGCTPTGIQHAKLVEVRHANMERLDSIRSELAPFDMCFYCHESPPAGVAEEAHIGVAFSRTMAAAFHLAVLNPQMIFANVSSPSAEAKGGDRHKLPNPNARTENALLRLRFKATYLYRPKAELLPLRDHARNNPFSMIYWATKPFKEMAELELAEL